MSLLLGIVIGVALSYAYVTTSKKMNKDIVETRRYFEYSCEATSCYNEMSKFFTENRDKLELISLKLLNGYSAFNLAGEHCVIARYKILDDSFKISL